MGRIYVQQSRLAAELINRYGGNIEVLMLRNDAGLKGSMHMPFTDIDNDKVAALLDKFLEKNKLNCNAGDLATDVITDYAKRFWYLYRLHSSCITTDRITENKSHLC